MPSSKQPLQLSFDVKLSNSEMVKVVYTYAETGDFDVTIGEVSESVNSIGMFSEEQVSSILAAVCDNIEKGFKKASCVQTGTPIDGKEPMSGATSSAPQGESTNSTETSEPLIPILKSAAPFLLERLKDFSKAASKRKATFLEMLIQLCSENARNVPCKQNSFRYFVFSMGASVIQRQSAECIRRWAEAHLNSGAPAPKQETESMKSGAPAPQQETEGSVKSGAPASQQETGESVNDDLFSIVMRHCGKEHLEVNVSGVRDEQFWKTAVWVLNNTNKDVRSSILRKCLELDDTQHFETHLLPLYCSEELDHIVTHLVSADQWESVDKLVRLVGDTKTSWTLGNINFVPETLLAVTTHEMRRLPYALRADMRKPGRTHADVMDRLFKVEKNIRCGDYGKNSNENLVFMLTMERSLRTAPLQTKKNMFSEWRTMLSTLHNLSDAMVSVTLTWFVQKRLWEAVGSVLYNHLNSASDPDRQHYSGQTGRIYIADSQYKHTVRVAVREADEKSMMEHIIPYVKYTDFQNVLQKLISRRFWDAASSLICEMTAKTVLSWASSWTGTELDLGHRLFWKWLRNITIKPQYTFNVVLALKKQKPEFRHRIAEYIPWDTPLCEVMWCCTLDAVVDIFLGACIPRDSEQSTDSLVSDSEQIWVLRYVQAKVHDCFEPLSQLFLGLPLKVRSELVLVLLTTIPVVPFVQNTALRVMLLHKRWKVLKLPRMSNAWEHVRRELFQAAVEQKQWHVVKQWADHALYDDQRLWALEEAYKHHQWDVMMVLADHGLNEAEQLRVYNRLFRHADWDVLQQLFDRGVNMLEMKELLLRETLRSKEAKNQDGIEAKNRDRINRLSQWTLRYKKLQERARLLRTFEAAVAQADWNVILYSIHKNPDPRHIQLSLKAGIVHKAWHVVMHLVRHEMDQARRDAMFVRMVRRRQWGVCRTLLETGISKDQCLSVLTRLMDRGQWTLVAFVVKHHDVGDRWRWDILERAMATRQGTVVWYCIETMQQRLSKSQRNGLFRKALLWEIWQAVNPLIEMKDDMGRRHRDQTLLAAIQQQQWDIVDHCQLQHADINVKGSDGNTPIHRAAQDKNWPSVNALAERDGDPSLLDSKGMSALHRAAIGGNWNTVKLLIQYHGGVHQHARHLDFDFQDPRDEEETRTPLQMIIDSLFDIGNKNYSEILDVCILWCPDLGSKDGVSEDGVTALHQACATGSLDNIYYLMTRGVDPFAVTKEGQSMLLYALRSRASQKMLAECINLGVSTHQPRITDAFLLTYWWNSPMCLALARNCKLAVALMLYESGACSLRELFMLKNKIGTLVEHDSPQALNLWKTLLRLIRHSLYPCRDIDNRIKPTMSSRQQRCVEYFLSVASQPRTLKSSCRLVISHCISVDKDRQEDIACLPFLSEDMKNFVMFQDLTDPDFGKDNSDHGEQDSYCE